MACELKLCKNLQTIAALSQAATETFIVKSVLKPKSYLLLLGVFYSPIILIYFYRKASSG